MQSYDEVTNTIIVIGGDAEDPISMDDVYASDLENGWGVVTNPQLGEYFLTARLQIGDGTTPTYFASSDNNIHFDIKVFNIKPRATVVLQKE